MIIFLAVYATLAIASAVFYIVTIAGPHWPGLNRRRKVISVALLFGLATIWPAMVVIGIALEVRDRKVAHP